MNRKVQHPCSYCTGINPDNEKEFKEEIEKRQYHKRQCYEKKKKNSVIEVPVEVNFRGNSPGDHHSESFA